MEKKLEILGDLKNHLSLHLGNDLQSVVLFGSQAKGKASLDSDYDVLIILKNKHNWKTKDKIFDLCYDIDLKYDIIIDPHLISEGELSTLRGKQPIFINALQNGIVA